MNSELINLDNLVITVYRKRVKNINLRISMDGKVYVSANKKVSLKRIENFVYSKKDWITSNIKKMAIYNEKKQQVRAIEYVTGDELQIQGKKYSLLVIHSDKNKAEIEDNTINLYISNEADTAKKKKIIDRFMNVLAQVKFYESLNTVMDLVKKYNISKPSMQIRKMRTRWGTCNRMKKKITINLELIKANKECLDYVILHELIHFLERGHNKVFYNYMTTLMPDWKTRKKQLNESHIL